MNEKFSRWQNWLGEGGGDTTYIYMYKQHSIVNTGNVNTDFKLMTHNRYSVLNGHFVRQIHSSSLFQLVSMYIFRINYILGILFSLLLLIKRRSV